MLLDTMGDSSGAKLGMDRHLCGVAGKADGEPDEDESGEEEEEGEVSNASGIAKEFSDDADCDANVDGSNDDDDVLNGNEWSCVS